MARHDETQEGPPVEAANDLQRTQELMSSVRSAAVLLALLLVVDWGTGRLALCRTALWVALAGLLFAVLCPARVTAGEGWLSSRRLLRERRLRTDALVSVRCLEGISQRLLLRDAFGGRVELDPEILVTNPQLWNRLDEGARKSAADGMLLCGGTALQLISQRVDRETARAVFKASGLE
ncbi:hypothetical protein [Streptomyces sp. NPDC001604]|uniref:hypothetical protein n=1 Tax=Streptomyces sp. NPDC001604 TaxID=3364593 RepID=UPI0036806AD5